MMRKLIALLLIVVFFASAPVVYAASPTSDSVDKEHAYAEAERLHASGDTAHAAMAFGRAIGYKDAWERCSTLWREIIQGRTIAVGGFHIIGLMEDGSVVATGDNSYGQCNISTWHDIISVAAGRMHTVGLRSNGTVVAVGYNGHGECNIDEWTDIVAVSAGYCTTIGLRSNGTVVAKGDFINSQLDFLNWRNIVAIDIKRNFVLGLKSDGTVLLSGNPDYSIIPGWTDVVAISSGGIGLGLRADGTVLSLNKYGGYQFDFSDWKDIVSIAAGDRHFVGLKADGTVKAVGSNSQGQINLNDWTDIVAISAGFTSGGDTATDYTVGLKSDGTVVAAGGSHSYTPCDVSSWHNIKVPSRVISSQSPAPTITAQDSSSNPDGAFDYTILQNEPGYLYDKFDDYWTWYAAYDEAYSDADLIIGIQLEGEVGGSDLVGATLYTKIMDKNRRMIDGVQSMIFLIDGVKYSYNDMPGEDGTMAGSVVLYKDGYELIKAFADAKEVSVKLKLFSGGTVMLDLDSTQFDRTLGNMCRKIIQYRVWDYYIDNPAVEMLEMMFPLEIAKK